MESNLLSIPLSPLLTYVNLVKLASLSLAIIMEKFLLSKTITFSSVDLHYPFLVLIFGFSYQNFNFLTVNKIHSAFQLLTFMSKTKLVFLTDSSFYCLQSLRSQQELQAQQSYLRISNWWREWYFRDLELMLPLGLREGPCLRLAEDSSCSPNTSTLFQVLVWASHTQYLISSSHSPV